MNQDAINLSVLGLSVDFKPGADMKRVREAVRLLEERYADQEQRFSKGQTKDILLTFLALGLADDLLQSRRVAPRGARPAFKDRGVRVTPGVSLGCA